MVLRLGPVRDSAPEDRVPHTTIASCVRTRKVTHIMDLMADQKVAFAVEVTDEAGNPVPVPAGTTVTFSVDDPALLNLTVNPDGVSGEVAAVGPLGSTILHAVGVLDGVTVTADEAINVIAGDAERFTLTFGEPEEVTPDA